MSGNSEETNMIQEGASSQTIVAHKTVYMNLKSTSQKCCLRSFLTIMIKNCWSRNFTGNRTLPKAITESPYFHIRVTKSKIVYLLVRSEHIRFNGSPSIPWLQWIQVIITWFSGIITLHQCMKKICFLLGKFSAHYKPLRGLFQANGHLVHNKIYSQLIRINLTPNIQIINHVPT